MFLSFQVSIEIPARARLNGPFVRTGHECPTLGAWQSRRFRRRIHSRNPRDVAKMLNLDAEMLKRPVNVASPARGEAS